MFSVIPDSYKDLLEAPVFVTLATLMPNNQPQLSVVWCSYDGTHILVNTARDRQKEKNLSKRPMVTILAVDPENPYRYLEVRGKVESIIEEGAVEHIDQLAQMYRGKSPYFGQVAPAEQKDKQTRVICKIKPTKVNAFGR